QIDIHHAAGRSLICAAVNHRHSTVQQSSNRGSVLKSVGRAVHLHITSEPAVAWRKKTGIDVLQTMDSSPPPKTHPAIIKHRNPRILLVPRYQRIPSKCQPRTAQIAVQPHRPDAKPFAVNPIVLPYDISAVGRKIDLRIDLVAGKLPGDWIFSST